MLEFEFPITLHTYPRIRASTHSVTDLPNSLTHSLNQSPKRAPTHSLTVNTHLPQFPLIYALTHSRTYSPTHSLGQALTHVAFHFPTSSPNHLSTSHSLSPLVAFHPTPLHSLSHSPKRTHTITRPPDRTINRNSGQTQSLHESTRGLIKERTLTLCGDGCQMGSQKVRHWNYCESRQDPEVTKRTWL